jgi:hypothetical protein
MLQSAKWVIHILMSHHLVEILVCHQCESKLRRAPNYAGRASLEQRLKTFLAVYVDSDEGNTRPSI